MIYSLLPTYAGIIFLIVLAVIYGSKNRIKSMREKFFWLLIIVSSILAITEIVYVLLYKYTNLAFIPSLFHKLHWSSYYLVLTTIQLYLYFVVKRIEANKWIEVVKYDFITKFITLFDMFFIVAILFLPIKEFNIENINYLSGSTAILIVSSIMTIGVLLEIFILVFLTNKKTLKKEELLGISSGVIVFTIFIILQIINKGMSYIPFSFVFICYSLYFNAENPDLRYIEIIKENKEKIELSNNSKNNFLVNMTDEISIPLGLINSLCTEMSIMDTFDETKFKQLSNEILSSSNNLLESVNNILNISEFESGNQNVHEKNYNISELLQNLVLLGTNKIGAKPLKFDVKIDQNISSVLVGDSTKLYQSLSNILINAIKYTDVGKITFQVTTKKEGLYENLQFKISDTGCGIENKEEVFLKVKDSNQGIGLPLTKQYIESIGGTIRFESEVMVGTTFYVDIKQKIANPMPIGEFNKKKEETIIRRDCTGMKALVVDDSLIDGKIAIEFLKKYNFEVEYVNSGDECLNKIKAENTYNVIFMDLSMSDLNGIETMKALKLLEGYQIPKIIALTANAMMGIDEIYLKEGFDGYLSKPINSNELNKVIDKL